MIENIPLPVTDDRVDQGYWQAALTSRLVVQTCDGCGLRRFPPRPMCPACQSERFAWIAVSGRGTIWSYAAPDRPLLPAFEALIPYVTAVVALEEDPGLRIVGPVLLSEHKGVKGVTAANVFIGQRVRVCFRRYADDVAMPCWLVETDGDHSEEDRRWT